MTRAMLLVSLEGATMAETRIDDEGAEADSMAQEQLREEALVSGFSKDEVQTGRFVFAGDPPNQP